MKRLLVLLLLAAPLLGQTPTPTFTPTRTPTITHTPTRTATRTPTPQMPETLRLAAQVRPGFGTFQNEPTLNKLGDTYYGVEWRFFGRVVGNVTTTRKFWRQVGTGSASAAPVWDTLVAGDIPNISAAIVTSGTLAVARGGTGTGSTLTGIVRGSASAFTAAELSGDATTSGSNAVTVVRASRADALSTTGASVDVVAAAPPVAGNVLTATDATHAIWQTAGAGAASDLLSATTTVNVSAATAPSVGQVLQATSSTAATWQTFSGSGNATSTGAYASKPGTCANGDLYLPNDSPYTLRCLSNAWVAVATLYTLPTDSAMSWVNQGSATVTQANGYVYMANASTPSGSYNAELRMVTAPSAPFTATAFVQPGLNNSLNIYGAEIMWGIWQRDSATGKLRFCGLYASASVLNLAYTYWANVTTPTTALATTTAIATLNNGAAFWLRLYDDNTNCLCQFSRDGVNFTTFGTTGRTVNLTANEIGYGINAPTALKPAMWLYSWKVQ